MQSHAVACSRMTLPEDSVLRAPPCATEQLLAALTGNESSPDEWRVRRGLHRSGGFVEIADAA